MTYFNTTNETPEQVKKFTKINNGQDKIILMIVRNLEKPFSSSLIWKEFISIKGCGNIKIKQSPLTSIRRSINTLKNLGYIEETGKRVMGLYGHTELQYKLSK